MNIQEMHNTFRTIGQQMGIQTIRGILPESIDVYLNNAIIDKVQQELLNGVELAMKDSVNTKAPTMTTINTFRTLYKTARYYINTDDAEEYTKKVSFYNNINGFHIINIPIINSNISLDEKEYEINPMMFLGFSVEYDTNSKGNAINCRLVSSDDLENTLHDYCNGASKDFPIAVLSSEFINLEDEQSEDDSNIQLEIYTSTKDCKVKFLNIKYIKVPNIVKFDTDLTKCVNCDLPSYTHNNIVERAVMKFYASIGVNTPNQNIQQ